MDNAWSWRARRRFLFLLKVVVWALYLLVVWLWPVLTAPGLIAATFADSRLALAVYGSVVVIPASVQLAVTYLPEVFLQNTVYSPISYTQPVVDQISRASNAEAIGVLRLNENLSNLSREAEWSVARAPAAASISTAWDEWVLVASKLIAPQESGARSSGYARVDIVPTGFRLLLGKWRPGVFLEVPLSRVVGMWRGSEVATIEGARVLVFVVQTDDDEILLPIEVTRWRSESTSSRSLEDLERRIEAIWNVRAERTRSD